MNGSAYLLPVIFMGAISAIALVAAVVLAFRGLASRQFSRAEMRALTFQFPDEPRVGPGDGREPLAEAIGAAEPPRPPWVDSHRGRPSSRIRPEAMLTGMRSL